MSDLPTPKYRIGDAVWYATTTTRDATYPCPDCLGRGSWTARSPAGEEHEFDCPRCRVRYVGAPDDLPTLTYGTHEPVARQLTVGSVSVKTHDYNGRPAVEYMCVETGVGSGTVYAEADLHPTEAAALEVARYRAAEANAKHAEEPSATRSRRFSTYTMNEALRQALWAKTYRAWEVARHYRELIAGALPSEQDEPAEYARLHPKLQEVSGELWEEIHRWEGYDFAQMQTPLDKLLAAARAQGYRSDELSEALEEIDAALALPKPGEHDEKT